MIRRQFFTSAITLVAGLAFSVSAHAARVYQVGTDAAYAPFEYQNEKGEVIGFDIEIIKAIAAKAGFEVKVTHTPWEGIFATLNTGERDIIISCVTITPARQKTMAFSEPYFEAKQLIVVGQSSQIGKFSELKNRKVGVQTGTTGDEAVQKLQGKTSTSIKRLETTPLALRELMNGGVEAVVADNGVVVNFLANNKGSKLKTIDDSSFEKEFYGIAVKKGNKELLDKINKGLAAIKADGTYARIHKKYFGN